MIVLDQILIGLSGFTNTFLTEHLDVLDRYFLMAFRTTDLGGLDAAVSSLALSLSLCVRMRACTVYACDVHVSMCIHEIKARG